jgi:hypothetical protein
MHYSNTTPPDCHVQSMWNQPFAWIAIFMCQLEKGNTPLKNNVIVLWALVLTQFNKHLHLWWWGNHRKIVAQPPKVVATGCLQMSVEAVMKVAQGNTARSRALSFYWKLSQTCLCTHALVHCIPPPLPLCIRGRSTATFSYACKYEQ